MLLADNALIHTFRDAVNEIAVADYHLVQLTDIY